MKNLKITFYFNTPIIMNRLTTIDSILLSSYYAFMANNGKPLEFDKEHKSVEFIHKENGVFSGSVWYIDEDEFVAFDFATIVKKPEYRKIYDTTGKKVRTSALHKGAMESDEMFIVDKLHFYIRADRKIVEGIIQNSLKNIGKYAKLNYGEIRDYDIEELEIDKGFMLNENTPSKPLPVSDFEVNSKKIAYSRRMAPYWLKEDIEACYMPSTAMYEFSDGTGASKYKVAKDTSYVSNVQFIYDKAFDKKIKKDGVEFNDSDYSTIKPHKKYGYHYVKDTEPSICAFSGDLKNEGVKNSSRAFLKIIKKSFADYGYMTNDDFVSKETLWCIDNIAALGYLMVDNNQWVYLQGKSSKEGKKINDFVKNPKLLSPPYSINLKKDKNAQHVSFKGKVSISNAFIHVQIGNKALSIDSELLMMAIADIEKITKKYPEITKSHLCRNFRDFFEIQLKKKNRTINETVVMNFQKKYDSNIRNLLALVAL